MDEERSQASPTNGRGGVSAAVAARTSSRTGDEQATQPRVTVNNPLTPNRARAAVENPEYAAFARRIVTEICSYRTAIICKAIAVSIG